MRHDPGHPVYNILRDVAELGDHDPDDPMVMMVTPDELQAILENRLGLGSKERDDAPGAI